MNCQSIRRKRTELHTSLEYIKPDIVCATETWLRGINPGKQPSADTISSSEIFPPDYNIYRNDRSTLGGGVLLMAHKSLTVEEQPHLVTNCEINWIKIKLKNLQDLYVGVFYMAHRNDYELNELKKSLDLLHSTNSKDVHAILAGDFNSPDIDWENLTVNAQAPDSHLQQKLVDVTATANLTQVHSEPTRLSALLDIIFTTNISLLKNSSSVPGISDHNMVVTDFVTQPQITKPQPRAYFKFSKANWENINSDLTLLADKIKNLFDAGENVDNLWSEFKASLNSTIQRNIPTGTAKAKSRLPWINRSILRLLRKKKASLPPGM